MTTTQLGKGANKSTLSFLTLLFWTLAPNKASDSGPEPGTLIKETTDPTSTASKQASKQAARHRGPDHWVNVTRRMPCPPIDLMTRSGLCWQVVVKLFGNGTANLLPVFVTELASTIWALGS